MASTEVVKDFQKAPTLEKLKKIPTKQRSLLIAQYLRVCVVVIWLKLWQASKRGFTLYKTLLLSEHVFEKKEWRDEFVSGPCYWSVYQYPDLQGTNQEDPL